MPPDFSHAFFADPEVKQIQTRFYPFYLDASSYRGPGYLALFATGALLVVFCIYGLRALRRWRDPSSHPAARRLASWSDPATAEMNAEREQRTPRFKGRGGKLTASFLVSTSV